MGNQRVLIIDDEPDIRELLSITLNRMGIVSDTVANLGDAKLQLKTQNYDLCLTDMRLPDGNGLELVEYIQHNKPRLPVAVITAHGSIDTAIDAMKAGAFDFLSKPVDLSVLRQLVTTAIQSGQLPPMPLPSDCPIIGQSKAIQELIASIQKLARSQAPIYISGESGVGKELVARSIHKLGPRAEAPFVAVNCGAIPKELMESEFFGHKKGSFTGAHQDKAGLFQTAQGGTLFLDEVADLPLDMQVKLLRAIQEKAVRPVGGQNEIKTDVRILCATHKALETEVRDGRFRQDLFYRLNVIQLRVPPLRERREDIAMLARHILEKLAKEADCPTPRLNQPAMNRLCEYDFPGNVRELENILERAFTLCDSQTINLEDLHLPDGTNAPGDTYSASTEPAQSHVARCADYPSLDHYLQDIEKDVLCHALERAKWNKTQAAKQLGISFRSLRYRLQKLGLDDD
ncbi:sigma-54-dependent transcriptional regulator [Marinimicrobium sp. ARAG 43.8]|uniref:sigma-54-dependent transcriptional regulator n=1 Tax=Marinimicrobium sp. ARAG 43.8 TaxID=3418719 RepID=UPI003CF7C191